MWKKSLIYFLCLFLGLYFGVAAINFSIDPYSIFHGYKIKFFNHIKSETNGMERVFKPFSLDSKNDVSTVLLGNSRVAMGLDPKNKNLSQYAYNFAFSGGSMHEAALAFDYSVKKGCKNFVICVDSFDINDNVNESNIDKRLYTDDRYKLIKIVELLFSVTTLEASTKTIISSLMDSTQKIEYTDDGLWAFNYKRKQIERQGIKAQYEYWKLQHKLKFDSNKYYANGNTKSLQHIIEVSKKENLQIKLFFNPLHFRSMLWEDISGNAEYTDRFKQHTVALVGKMNATENVQIFDFYIDHKLNAEIPRQSTNHNDMTHWWDSSHYKKELGDIVLDRMFDGNFSGGQDYPDFGVKLTSQNIEAHLAKLRADRTKWRASHPADVAEIDALKSKK